MFCLNAVCLIAAHALSSIIVFIPIGVALHAVSIRLIENSTRFICHHCIRSSLALRSDNKRVLSVLCSVLAWAGTLVAILSICISRVYLGVHFVTQVRSFLSADNVDDVYDDFQTDCCWCTLGHPLAGCLHYSAGLGRALCENTLDSVCLDEFFKIC